MKELVAKIFDELDDGTITMEEANARLKEANIPYCIDLWKNHIGRNEHGYGMLNDGFGGDEKVKVIEDENGIRLEKPVFNPESFEGYALPVYEVEYEGTWYKVADDGFTLR